MASAMTAPMFSIIVPTFNTASTLDACLRSIVGQTCNDFEVVLVDGGSTDGTLDTVKTFASELDTRLVSHSGPDDGPYDAMNRGVDMASGSWVLFLGADDVLYEADTLARVAAFIDGHDSAGLVYGDVINRSTGTRHAGEFDLDRLLFETNMCHQAIFYRRELFAGIGPYNLRYRIWADWDFNIRCLSNPALVTRYMDIVVTLYNDVTGISSAVDKEFRKRLPIFFWAAAAEISGRTLALFKQKEVRQAVFRQWLVRFKARS